MSAFRRPMFLIALALASPAVAWAQPGQIGSYNRPRTNNQPAISPYLNLNRGGAGAINYYGLVRPQLEANRAFEQIQQGTFGMDPRFAAADGGANANQLYPDQAIGLQTGHPASFFNYSHYYQFPNAQRGGGGAGGTGFGRPNSPSMPFFFGSGNGVVMPVNPAGANPLGGPFGGGFSGSQYSTVTPQAPPPVVMP